MGGMTDPDQPGEDFDDELLEGEFPPEEPLGAEDEGVTGIEQLGGESFAEREERTEPEPWERRPGDGEAAREEGVELVGDDAGVPDEEKDLVAERASNDDDHGPLAPDDELSGDETTRDIAPERDPHPAEEAAVEVDEEEPSG
jgi:hypothetical protein